MTGLIILAAGASTRLGRPKQTLNFNGKSLLNHTIDAAINSRTGPVVVVIGSNNKEISSTIEKEAISIVLNENWKEGIASSIRSGLSKLLEDHKNIENVILLVCDQPYLHENLLKELLLQKAKTGKPIIASSYNGTLGVPALFDKNYFDELLGLEGDHGGKKILLNHQDQVASIPFLKGSIDIDTSADYEKLIR